MNNTLPHGSHKISILVVDDELPIRTVIQRLISEYGYNFFTASNGKEALKVLAQESVDVVVTDISMPEMDGIELTKNIGKQYDADVIMMTGYIKDSSYGKAVAHGAADFIQKPFDGDEFRIRLNRVLRERRTKAALKESLITAKEILDGVVQSLSATVEARDPYTSGHQKRVAALAVTIAEYMNLSEDQCNGIEVASLIHDLGKIAIPAEILSKPGSVTEIEYSLLKTHAQIGYNIVKDIKFPLPIADMIHQHHERMNGSGYPLGLKGTDILFEARIIAVADVVEAMSSFRPYRPALGIEKAIEEIVKNKNIFYDAKVVDACIQIIEDNGFAWS